MLVDLDEGQARMLFMVGAEAAIERTAVIRARLEGERNIAGLKPVPLLAPIGGIGRDQRLLHTVRAAALLVIDRVTLDEDLGRNRQQAGLAKGRRLAEELIWSDVAHGAADSPKA